MNRRLLLAAIAALAMFTSAAQINNAGSQGYFARGIAMFNDGNYAGCIDQMRYFSKLNPESASAETVAYYIAMASLHQGLPDAKEMATAFLQTYQSSPLREYVKLAIADYLFDSGSYAEAESAYSAINNSALDAQTRLSYYYHEGVCILKNISDNESIDDVADVAARRFERLLGSREYGNDALFYLAYCSYVKSNYDKALELFAKVKPENDGPTSMTDYYLAQLYYRANNFERAYSTAKQLLARKQINATTNEYALEAFEYTLEALRILGESAYSLNKLDEAVEKLSLYAAATKTPELSAMYVLGLSQYRLGEYDKAIDDLTEVSKENNEMGQSASLLIGQSYLKLGNYSPAMMALDKAYRLDYNPELSEAALYNYAVAKMQGGKVPFGSSADIFKRFLSRYPNSRYADEVRTHLVAGYMSDNNYESALASINEIAKPNREMLCAKQQVLYALGTREVQASKPVEALNHFQQAKKLGNLVNDVYKELDLWIGEAEYKQKNYAAAARSYQAYLKNLPKSNSNYPLANYDLGYAFFGEKKFGEAYTAFERFNASPGSASARMKADALNRMADCRYYESQFDRAAELYDRAFETDPSAGDYALFQKAIMKGLRRDNHSKINGLREMMNRFPQSGLYPTAMLETGEAWQELSETAKAIETFTDLSSRFPTTEQGRQGMLLLALAYLNSENTQRAEATYRNIVSRYPSSEQAKVAVDDLKRIAAENGTLAEFTSFLRSVPNAPVVDQSELEQLAFDTAERDYLKNGNITRIEAYIKDYPSGQYMADALIILARKKENADARIALAGRIIENYPHAPSAEEAYLIKGDALFEQNRPEEALQTYLQLEKQASSSQMLNAARLGAMRSARDLDDSEHVILAADRILSSSTLGSNERDEVMFSRALAHERVGDSARAVETWEELAKNPQQLYGAKASYYLAQLYFNNNNKADARRVVDALIEANPPHYYWLAKGFILLSDIYRSEGNKFEADEYLRTLRENYPGSEPDIFAVIDQRLTENEDNQ